MRMTPEHRVFVAGHRGLVGSALMRALARSGHAPERVVTRARAELDLRDQRAVDAFFGSERPDVVLLAAARVGGILANSSAPATFVTENLQIQTNVIESARAHGVELLLFLGSSCIYPRACPQPMREEHLLTGPLEPTNAPYAVAKIAGVTQCLSINRQHGTRYVPVMPTNLYGPGDNFDLATSHVLPALMRKMHEAKERGEASVEVWGSGRPLREFLHADDLADACLHILTKTDCDELINIGSGHEIAIADLARAVADAVGFEGDLVFDPTKPDGTPRKWLDTSKLTELGWRPRIDLRDGIARTYEWYLASTHDNQQELRT